MADVTRVIRSVTVLTLAELSLPRWADRPAPTFLSLPGEVAVDWPAPSVPVE